MVPTSFVGDPPTSEATPIGSVFPRIGLEGFEVLRVTKVKGVVGRLQIIRSRWCESQMLLLPQAHTTESLYNATVTMAILHHQHVSAYGHEKVCQQKPPTSIFVVLLLTSVEVKFAWNTSDPLTPNSSGSKLKYSYYQQQFLFKKKKCFVSSPPTT